MASPCVDHRLLCIDVVFCAPSVWGERLSPWGEGDVGGHILNVRAGVRHPLDKRWQGHIPGPYALQYFGVIRAVDGREIIYINGFPVSDPYIPERSSEATPAFFLGSRRMRG